MSDKSSSLRRAAAALLAILAAWAALRYLVPTLLPFILAWLTASFVEPVVRHMTERFGIRRGFSCVLCCTAVMFSVLGIGALAVTRIAWELADLASELPERLGFLPGLLRGIQGRLSGIVESAPPELKAYITGAGEGIAQAASELPGQLSARLLVWLTQLAGRLPSAALFAATWAVGTFFISLGYRKIMAFALCQLGEAARSRALEASKALRCGFGKWFKAQLTMSGIMFLLLLVSFSLLRVASPLVLSLITALVDALPVLGVGTVLVPWALWEALNGAGSRAAVITAIWLGSLGARSFIEPRLVGRQSGLNPAAALLAAYCGWRFCGVGGLVAFPLLLVMLKEVNDQGVLHLWRTLEDI